MNAPFTLAAEGLPRRPFTVKQVLRMVEMGVIGHDERFELIGGEIVPMSPKGIRHEIIKAWIIETLVRGLPKHLQTVPETTFYLSDDTFIEPDFVVYPRGKLAELSPQSCLLAIEIGDSSLAYDLGRKAEIYAQFGIGELWVINARTLVTCVHRDPVDDRYGSVEDVEAGMALTPLRIPELSIDLAGIDL